MNGQLHVDSEVGRGSTFTVTLPLEPAVLPAAATECADVDDLSILVVDDDEVNRELGRRQLDVLGLRSVVAASGERAIELLHDGYRPTLVLMDQQMPGMTGLETLAAMRRMGADTAAIPVVMVTGSVTEADQSAFAEANVAGVVAKPASVDDIRQAMSEPLRQLRLRRFIDPMVLERLAADFQGAGSDVVVSIVESFLDELPQRCEQLVEAIAAGDVVGCRRSAHTLKSSSRLVGAVRLADACAQLEAELCSTVDVTAIMHCTAEALSTWRERR
jgi:CheY-like chemotaxis protein/HPt (histidine-containing phosphotransfer) domain-containing protein